MKVDFKVGFHVSISGGIFKSFERAESLGCRVFQIFLVNPRSWRRRPLIKSEIEKFTSLKRKSPAEAVAAHLSYLPNLASPEKEVYEKSVSALLDELSRAELLGIPFLVVHPGKSMGESEEKAIERIANALKTALKKSVKTTILLETTAGQGTELGYRIEHLERILHLCENNPRIGICLDTAHLFEAGYPIHEKNGLSEFSEMISELIGWEKVKLIHLNDSLTPLGSRTDRHWHIGEGYIGRSGFENILSHPRIQRLPIIMETPWGEEWDRKNLKTLLEIIRQVC